MKMIFFLLSIFNSLLWADIEKEKWKTVQICDSLEILLNGRHAGTLNSTVEVKDSVVEFCNILDMETLVYEKRVYGFDGSLISAEQKMVSSAGENYWKLSCDSGYWSLLMRVGGMERRNDVPVVKESIKSFYEIYSGIMDSSLEIGSSWTDSALELTSGEHCITTTVCREKPDKKNGYNWVLVSRNNISGKEEIWKLDRKGKTVYREIYPLVARLRDTSSKKGKLKQKDLIEAFKIEAKRRVAANEQIFISFDSTYQLDASVIDYYQKSEGGYLLKDPEVECGKSLLGEKIADSLKIYTLPTATVQSDHPDIIRLSEAIQKNSDSLCDLVRVFNDSVYRMLKKRNTATFSSAVETLNAGFGDCGEHSVLLAALLRAAGIPARVVMGLVYMESGKGYYYHAWVSAYTGKWIFADPSHGMFPAGRDRIPLVIDDAGEKTLQLSRLFGKIKVGYKQR
jgi:transglutaminase-like putative cysteine protease